jgi:hypothetical protein
MADEPRADAVPDAADAGASTSPGSTEGVNQGATGNRPLGETPLSATHTDKDAYDERPEAFVGAAFAGGLALALLLRRVAK